MKTLKELIKYNEFTLYGKDKRPLSEYDKNNGVLGYAFLKKQESDLKYRVVVVGSSFGKGKVLKKKDDWVDRDTSK